MSETKEIQACEHDQAISNPLPQNGGAVDQILALAIQQGAPLEQLEKWMELKRQHEAHEAKKAYVAAMARFKADPPKIMKDKSVGYSSKGSKVGYSHASLGNVTEKITAGLASVGISPSWALEQPEGSIKVTCTLTHALGHSESTSLTTGADTSGSKNSIQAIGSTISYLERYTILALTGLATHDIDDDGAGSEPVDLINTDQQIVINDLIKETYTSDTKKKQWLDYMGVDSVDKIAASQYKKALNSLKRAKGGQ